MKELGKTTFVLLLTQYECAYRTCKFVRYIHSDHNQVTEFLNAIYNFFLSKKVRAFYGDLIASRGKEEEKKRYTQTVINLQNGVTIKGMSSLQTGVGTVDLDTKARVDRQYVDDPTNVLRALSERLNTKDKRVVDEVVRGCDQAESSIILLCNAIEPYDSVQEVKRDQRFHVKRYFLFQEKEEKQENLIWKGKFVMKDTEVEQGGKRKVSVEQLRKDPDYRKSFLGELVNEKDLFFKNIPEPSPSTTEVIEGQEVLFFKTEDIGACVLATDSSEGIGRDQQALTVFNENREVVATFASSTIATQDFARLVDALARRLDALLVPENDGMEGKLLIHILIEKYSHFDIFRERQEDRVSDTMKRQFGFVPNPQNKQLIYSKLRDELEYIKVNCPHTIEEMKKFTYEVKRNWSRCASGHFDRIRTLAIANYAVEELDRSRYVGLIK